MDWVARRSRLNPGELVREPARGLKALDLALAGRRDEPEAVLAERIHGHLADAQERTRGVRLPCCRLAVQGAKTSAENGPDRREVTMQAWGVSARSEARCGATATRGGSC